MSSLLGFLEQLAVVNRRWKEQVKSVAYQRCRCVSSEGYVLGALVLIHD